MTIAAELARRIGAITFAEPAARGRVLGEGRHPRHGRRHAGRRGRELRAHRVRGGGARPAPRWCSAPAARRPARCGADQRHRRARARLRRLQQHAGRPSVGADPAGAVRAGRDDARSQGATFIAAYVAGFETETRIARGVNFHHYEKGWHPTATLGVFGAAAACSHLLGLDAGRDGHGAGARRLARVGHQGQFRHHDEAAARRPHLPQRPVRGAAGGRRLHRQRGRLRAQAGLLPGVQRRRQLRCGGHARRLGRAARHRRSRASRSSSIPAAAARIPRIDAMLALVRRACARRRRWWSGSTPGPIRAASPTPTGPIRKSELDAKFSVQYCLARALTARPRSGSSTSRATPTRIRTCARCCRASMPRRIPK